MNQLLFGVGHSLRRNVAFLDIAVLWFFLFLSLTYLEVPLVSALLLATSLVLQAALGAELTMRLLPGAQTSLLMLCGPGIILGSSVSFTIFQVFGRGTIGLVASLITGLGCLVLMGLRSATETFRDSRVATVAHLLGLAALAVSSEFVWLLIVAVPFYIVAAILESRSQLSMRVQALLAISVGSVALLAVSIRGESWSLVSDDYLFFEVMSRHLVSSGPLDDWGTFDFSRYHWMSYGWSGLLDLQARSPGTLVTLSRVMPLVYSVSLAASVLMILARVSASSRRSFLWTIPAWTLLCNFRLDWSGTSTAGVMAVIMAFVAIVIVQAEVPQTAWQRLVVYAIFSALILLTKAPSILVVPSIVTVSELFRFAHRTRLRHASIVTCGGVAVSGIATLLSLPIFSKVVGGFSLEWGMARGDDLGRQGLATAITSLAWRHSWLLILMVLAWTLYFRDEANSTTSEARSMLLSLSPSIVICVVMDAIVVGNANTSDYFSQPQLLLASMSLLTLTVSDKTSIRVQFGNRTVTLRLLTLGLVLVAAFTLRYSSLSGVLTLPVLRHITADARVLGGVVVLFMLLPVKRVVPSVSNPIYSSWLCLLVLMSTVPTVRSLLEEGRAPIRSDIEMVALEGPPDAKTIAEWLRDNSDINDLVATNYLRNKASTLHGDYSLAAWSQREFLILGPALSFKSPTTLRAIELSETFAESPTPEVAADLVDQGVKWFIVDLDTTTTRTWEPYAEVVAMTWRFWLLKLKIK